MCRDHNYADDGDICPWCEVARLETKLDTLQRQYETELEATGAHAWKKTADLRAENADLHEQVAALQSREVCNSPHENVEECGYCQRDRALLRLDATRRLLDELETWEHPDDPGKSIIDSKGYQLIEKVGVMLGDEGPEKAAEAVARYEGGHSSTGEPERARAPAGEDRETKA